MWSPVEIEHRLVEAVAKLDDAVGDLKDLADRAGAAKADYELANSKAMLLASREQGLSSEGDRKAWALTRCADEKREHEVLSHRWLAQRQVLEVMRSQVEILRSLLVQSRWVQDQGPPRREPSF